MSGETEQQVSGWTTDTLKAFHDEKIDALKLLSTSADGRISDRLEALENVVKLLTETSSVAQEKFSTEIAARFVAVNEFRGSLDDLSKQMATRRELEVQATNQTAVIEDLRKTVADLRSRIDIGPTGLAGLQSASDAAAGRHAANQLTVTHFFAGLAAVIAIAGLLFAVTRQKQTVFVPTTPVTSTQTR